MSLTGEDGKFYRSGIGVADLSAAMSAAIGVLAAVNLKQRTGIGQRVETSIFGSMVFLLADYLTDYAVSGEVPGPVGNCKPGNYPYGVFETKNRPIAVGAGHDKMWATLCSAIGLEHLVDDPELASSKLRWENREKVDSYLKPLFFTKTSEEWVDLLEKHDIACAPVNTLDKVVDHPQTEALDMVIDVNHTLGGTIQVVGNPIKFQATPVDTFTSPPLLGEHTEELLGELLGYSTKEIEELIERQVIMKS
jgi:CoA:oxalate CoA-transferase